jgi:hypothetical protein
MQGVNQCAWCHADHRGVSFDPSASAMAAFDHSTTRFSLNWHTFDYQVRLIGCYQCHTGGEDFTISTDKCAECHLAHEQAFSKHILDYGAACMDCHDGYDRMIGFQHATTRFPLEGAHAGLKCTACHQRASQVRTSAQSASARLQTDFFKNAPTECDRCHDEPPAHRGVFNDRCADCHTATSWKPATLKGAPFSHAENTSFSLARHQTNFDETPITCTDCHQDVSAPFDVERCIACHVQDGQQGDFMDRHIAQYGKDCTGCHDGADRMHNFDHAAVFPLDGRHAQIACADCHANQVFAGTPAECARCHAEPGIHKGFFGVKCQYCHSTQAWAPAPLRIHPFPLEHGGQGQSECKVCHQSRYTDYTCYGCHEHNPDEVLKRHLEEGIKQEELPKCVECHPNG